MKIEIDINLKIDQSTMLFIETLVRQVVDWKSREKIKSSIPKELASKKLAQKKDPDEKIVQEHFVVIPKIAAAKKEKQSRRWKPTKICENCGTEFEKAINISKESWEKRRFCNNKCRSEFFNKGEEKTPSTNITPVVQQPEKSVETAYCH